MYEHSIKKPQNGDTSQILDNTTIDSDEMHQGNTNTAKGLELLLQNQEGASSKLQVDRQKLSVANACDSEINELRRWKEGAERELQQLRAASSSQGHTLQRCQWPVGECEIMDHFDDLCHDINNWVGVEMFHFEERFGIQQDAIMDGGSPYMKDVLESNAVAGEYLVGALIHAYIQQRFFGENAILFGIPEPITSLLYETGICMAKLNPEKGWFTSLTNDFDRDLTD